MNHTPPADSLVHLHQIVFDRLPLGIVIWEMENPEDIYTLKLRAANAAASSVSGIDIVALVGKTVVDMVAPGTSPADMPPIFHAYQETIRTGEGRDLGEVRVDQEQVTSVLGDEIGRQVFQIQTIPLPDHRAMAIFENITIRKQAEESLAARETQLHAVLSNAPLLLVTADKDMTIALAEGTLIETLFPATPRLVGQSILTLAGRYPGAPEAIRRAFAGEEAAIRLEDGARVLESRYLPVRDQQGAVTGMLMVAVDITAQIQAEMAAQQARHQEELIRAQEATLRELSTPFIPISDQIAVLPLIGSIDSRRAQQVLETVLEGVAATRSQIVILDITGVQVVDTQVANALLRTAQAVKLLGTRLVLTGIRPEVAQTLVGLGADLSDIITRGTLQSGIAYALA